MGDGLGMGDGPGAGDDFGAGDRLGAGDDLDAGAGGVAEPLGAAWGCGGAGRWGAARLHGPWAPGGSSLDFGAGAFFFGGANKGRISDRLPVPPVILRTRPSPLAQRPEKLARVEPARREPFRRRAASPSTDRSTVTSTGSSSPRGER